MKKEPNPARRILFWFGVAVVLLVSVYFYFATQSLCCAPPGPIGP